MKKHAAGYKVTVVLCLLIALCSSEAFAERGGPGRPGGPSGHERHYYQDGKWYRHGWFWLDTAVAALTVGALVDSLPPRCTTVVYGGVPYYYDGGYYYRSYPYGGYVVVQPPVVIPQSIAAVPQPSLPAAVISPEPLVQSQTQSQDVFTVNVPNFRGGYTPVSLKRSGNGFVGPQGEYYTEFPKVEQLKAMYGK